MPWIDLALVMNLTRFAMTDVQSYVYMNWNLFLAFLPLLFIFLFERVKNIYKKSFYFLAWLFFLPNAIYMITDLIHLRDVGPDWMLWFDGMMLFSYALIGILISLRFVSLCFSVQANAKTMIAKKIDFVFIFYYLFS